MLNRIPITGLHTPKPIKYRRFVLSFAPVLGTQQEYLDFAVELIERRTGIFGTWYAWVCKNACLRDRIIVNVTRKWLKEPDLARQKSQNRSKFKTKNRVNACKKHAKDTLEVSKNTQNV